MGKVSEISIIKPGACIAYPEAFKAYSVLECYMVSRVYSQEFRKTADVDDLMGFLNDLALKRGLSDKEAFRKFFGHLRHFLADRAVLLEGPKEGEKCKREAYSTPTERGECQLFEAGVDGDALRRSFDECIGLLFGKSEDIGGGRLSRFLDRANNGLLAMGWDDDVNRIMTFALVALWVCLIVCMLVHTLFGVGPCTKWLV